MFPSVRLRPITAAPLGVCRGRFWGQSGHHGMTASWQLMTRSGHQALTAVFLEHGRNLCPPPLSLPSRSDRLPLIREAFRLEWLTIGWMTVEAIIAIAAGVTAGGL